MEEERESSEVGEGGRERDTAVSRLRVAVKKSRNERRKKSKVIKGTYLASTIS